MNFLDKLNYLMNKNNLNKNTLSKACDIPYTTIDGWYKKGYEGLKLPTLRKLSNYFSTTLDYWADDTILDPAQSINKYETLQHSSLNLEDIYSITDDELKKLLDVYSKLPEISRQKFVNLLEDLVKEESK